MVTLPPNSDVGHKFAHPGEEFVFVLEGTLQVELEETVYTVEAGESIHYSSTIQHFWANPTDRELKLLTVTTPSIFK